MTIHAELDPNNTENITYIISGDDLEAMFAEDTKKSLDMAVMVDYIDLLTEAYRTIVHLNQTVAGIVSAAEGQLDLHRRRTIRGMQKKMEKLTAQVLDICDDADEALEEMSERWDFAALDAMIEDEV
jgi:hypothetical protein